MKTVLANFLDVIITFLLLFLYMERFVNTPLTKLLPIILLIWLTIKYHFKNQAIGRRRSYMHSTSANLLFLLISIVSIATLRDNNPAVGANTRYLNFFSFVFFATACHQVFRYIDQRFKDRFDVYYYIIISPFFLFILTNLIFWSIGFKGTDEEGIDIGNSVTLSYFGINYPRVKFPFTNGINSYGTLVGGVLTIQLVYFFVMKQRNLIGVAFIASSLLTLFLTDSRSAVVYPIIITALLFWISRWKEIKKLRFITWAWLLGPLLISVLLPMLAAIPLFSDFSRSSEDFATGNSRFVIWLLSLKELLNFKLIHLVGYGLFGHYASGVSFYWAHIFGLSSNSIMVHPHNSVFSIIFDYGYILLFILLWFIGSTIKTCANYWSSRRQLIILYLGFLVYFILISVTESFFGFYYLDSIYFIILFFFLITKVNTTFKYGKSARVR